MSEKNLLTRLKKTARKYTGPALIGFTSLISVIPKIANAQEIRNKTVIYYSEETWRDSSFDFNGDKKVDVVDFFMFADAYGRRDRPRFDLDHDGIVGLTELFGLADVYGMDIAVKEPTTAILNLSPDTGEAPLETRIIVGGRCDPDLNIEKYCLILPDSTIVERSWPIDTTIVSEQPGNFPITGQVFDTRGTSNAKTAQIQVTPEAQESVTQEVTLENKVDINYTATLENTDHTTLKIFRGDRLMETREITGDFTHTFTGMEKGVYNFVALNDTTQVTVPDYPTEINLSSLGQGSLELDEESSTTISLEGLVSDDNPEDNPRLAASSLDGKTIVRLDGPNLEITGNIDAFGDYTLRISAMVEGGTESSEDLSGYLHPLARISGTVKSNETEENVSGTIWVYDSGWNLLETTNQNPDTSNTTDAGGRFSLKTKRRASELESLIVQGGHGVPEVVTTPEHGTRTRLSESYVRTVKDVSSGDDVNIVAVPYGEYRGRELEFLTYFVEQNVNPTNNFDFTGELVRSVDPDLSYDDLKIIIRDSDPFGSEFFTREQQEHYKQRMLDQNDINSLTPGGNFITEDMIFFGDGFEGEAYTLPRDAVDAKGNREIVPEQGVIIISPRSYPESGSNSKLLGSVVAGGGVIYLGYGGGVSNVSPEIVGKTLSHEFGHLFMGGGHPETLYDETIMTYQSGRPTTVGPADKKQAKILNTRDYIVSPVIEGNVLYPRVDFIGNIMAPYVGGEDTELTARTNFGAYQTTIHPRHTKEEF